MLPDMRSKACNVDEGYEEDGDDGDPPPRLSAETESNSKGHKHIT